MRKFLIFSIFTSMMLFSASYIFSHCEIPCGIYGDEIRFEMIQEHISTIEKSIKKIDELSQQKEKNYNQLVRWIHNKEKHAGYIQQIVSGYFMTQRIKPVDKKDEKEYQEYIEKITSLHRMLIYAMRAKQTTELANIEKLHSSLKHFKQLYLPNNSGKSYQ